MRATIGVKHSWHFGDAQVEQPRLDHHFERELHSRGTQIHSVERFFAKTAKPAEQVPDRAAEEEPSDPRESGIPQVSILPRHRTRLDTAEKPIAHHEVTTSAKLLHERRQVREIIAVVGVTHDDETATSDA